MSVIGAAAERARLVRGRDQDLRDRGRNRGRETAAGSARARDILGFVLYIARVSDPSHPDFFFCSV